MLGGGARAQVKAVKTRVLKSTGARGAGLVARLRRAPTINGGAPEAREAKGETCVKAFMAGRPERPSVEMPSGCAARSPAWGGRLIPCAVVSVIKAADEEMNAPKVVSLVSERAEETHEWGTVWWTPLVRVGKLIAKRRLKVHTLLDHLAGLLRLVPPFDSPIHKLTTPHKTVAGLRLAVVAPTLRLLLLGRKHSGGAE